MYKTSLLFFLVISFFACQDEISVVEIGKPIPNYNFNTVLNTSRSQISLNDLKGKVVILEFWATWCGPCIPAMKKLDSLQSKFDKDIQVVTISNESTERLEKFIKTTNIKLPIASDTLHGSLFKYKIIPHSILIDKKGIVRGITNPENITEALIEDLIVNKSISPEIKDDFYIDPSLEVETINSIVTSNYMIELKGYDQENRGGFKQLKELDGTVNGVEIWNSPIPRMYQTLFDVSSPHRISFEDDLSYDDFPYYPEYQYNLKVEASSELGVGWRQLGIDFLDNHFGINARMATDTLECYVLINEDNILKKSKSKESSFSFMGPIMKAKKIDISELVDYIENFTNIPVVDQTNLKYTYDIDLEWQTEDPSTLFTELEKHGLLLKKYDGKLPVEVMKVYKKIPKL